MKREYLVLAFAAVMYFTMLGGHDLWAPDEPRYGEVAREMLIDGSWIVPKLNDEVYDHKPPLLFWLIALASLPVGAITEFTARLPSVISALITVWLTISLGRRFFGEPTGLLAGLILCTSVMFWDKARWVQIDALLCCLIWSALVLFVRFRAGELSGRLAGRLFWLFLALAALAKGPVGFLLPLLVALITLVWDREIKRWRDFAPISGPGVFILVCGAWIAAAEIWGPEGYSVLASLKTHFLDRGMKGLHHLNPWWYYLERLPLSILPWAGLLPGAFYLAWRRRVNGADRFVLVASLLILLFFSVSAEKRDLYVLPAFPALALLMASLVTSLSGMRNEEARLEDFSPKWFLIGHGIISTALLVLGLVLLVKGRESNDLPYSYLAIGGVGFFLTGLLSLLACIRGKVVHAVFATAVGMGSIFVFASSLCYPAINDNRSVRSFAHAVKEQTSNYPLTKDSLLAWGLENIPYAVAFYSNGIYSTLIYDPERIVEHFNQPQRVFAMVNADLLDEELRVQLSDSWVLAEATLSRRLVYFLSNKPLEGSRNLADRLDSD